MNRSALPLVWSLYGRVALGDAELVAGQHERLGAEGRAVVREHAPDRDAQVRVVDDRGAQEPIALA
jgi:hypothetical protein